MGLDQNDHNKGGYQAFMFSMIFSFLFFAYVSFLHSGVVLDNPKIKQDANVKMAGGESAQPAEDVSKNPTPWIPSPAMVAYGKGKYQATCAVCHGDAGLGNGPAGASLNPKPRNFVEDKYKRGATSDMIFITIRDGLPGTGMASFGHLPVVDRWAITHFVRSLIRKPPSDNAAEVEKLGKEGK